MTRNAGSGFTLAYPDGSQDIYGFIVTNTGGAFQKAFLTERRNPQSQKTRLYYASYNPANPVIRLSSVVDGDGRTNWVYYIAANAYSSNLIAQVVDAFARTNFLSYDQAGHLTNIVDVSGIWSSISYDGNDWVSSLTTPYGTTAFVVTDTTGTNAVPNGRSVLVTQPDGGHQLYAYQDSAAGVPWSFPTNDVPSTAPFSNAFENSQMNFRNTFFWGPRQYAALSTTNISAMTSNDFRKARLKHWLKGDYYTVSQILSMQRDPSPDNAGSIEGQKTWYDYVAKHNSKWIGTQAFPLLVARQLPDGSSSFTRTDRNSLGAVTTNVTTFSVGATVMLRTNIASYAANGIDVLTATNALGIQISSNSYKSSKILCTTIRGTNCSS